MRRWSLALSIFAASLLITATPGRASRASDSGPDLSLYPLLYRNPAIGASTRQDSAAQIMMVGDVSFARGVAAAINSNNGNSGYPLSDVSDWLHISDLAVGNYEGVIAAPETVTLRPQGYRLEATPDSAVALAQAGFGLLSLANNHTLDAGPPGLQATLDNLHAAGIRTVGAGSNGSAARQPVITTVRGVRIAWLSFNAVSAPDDDFVHETLGYGRSNLDESAVRSQIAAARQLASIVIVQMHWGVEYQTQPTTAQIRIARAAIDAGASLVIGHHPHVIQPIEVYRGKFIAYSLGNFLFDQDHAAGLALWIRLDTRGLLDVHALVVHPGVHPRWKAPASAAASLHDICLPGTPTGFRFVDGRYTPVAIPSDASHSRRSALDMRGDGQQETVTLRDGVLRILDGDNVVYESFSAWPVVDYAVGDPNQDGRFEVLMLLWRQDNPSDPVTTHPFIVGYRKGQYQVIWGGSATPAWVQSVGVADVDNDQLDDLVTIEREPASPVCDPTSRVVVMKWNGWGFTRDWSSNPGALSNLAFDDEIPPAIITYKG